MFLITDLQSIHDGEPRVRDLTLAERLGFERVHKVRDLIGRNLAELEAHGGVFSTMEKTSETGGRPGIAYWLNEPQALLICMFSRTPKAAEVRRALIDVFTAYRRNQLEPRGSDLDALTADLNDLALKVCAPIWSVYRRMLWACDVIDGSNPTVAEVERCRQWLSLGGDYERVPAEYWRRRYAALGDDVHRAVANLRARWQRIGGTSASFVYNRMASETGVFWWTGVTADDVRRCSQWAAAVQGSKIMRADRPELISA